MADCIEHTQATPRYGYGSLQGVKGSLHRIAYCKANCLLLEDIKGKVVMHSCDNPRCIQPAHLSLGTSKDNTQDMFKKGRANRVSGQANPTCSLTPEQASAVVSRYVPRCRVNGTRALAKELGVTHQTISLTIRRNK